MSNVAPPMAVATATGPPEKWYQGRNLYILLTAGGIFLLSLARTIADADSLTGSDTVGLGLRFAIPIAMAGIGGLWAERSGTVNIGLEGMMIMGTIMAGYAGWQWGPWAALVAGAIGGIFAGLLLGLATIPFGVNQIVAGFAINLIAPGVARFLANLWFTTPEAMAAGGSISNGPAVSGSLPDVTVPVLSGGPDLLGDLEDTHWFFLSDVAGILGGVTRDVRLDIVVSIALIIVTSYVVWRTPFGLRLRSAGEKPSAGDSLGVNVILMRWYGLILSGAFAGIGGAVFVFAGANRYQQGQTQGTGFLGLAALVFGNWMPSGVFAGAGVFGYAQGLEINLRASAVVLALILAIGMALLCVVTWGLVTRRRGAAIAGAIGAAICLLIYFTVDEINANFIQMTPYVVTLLVVSIFSQRLRPPAAEGIPYFKGKEL